MSLMLDACVLIDLMRGDRAVRAAYTRACLAQTAMAVSVLAEQELRFGAELSAQPETEHALIDAWLADKPRLPYELQDARSAARLQAEMERAGRRAPLADFLIGAHAMARGLAVVTSNPRHFQHIPGLTLHDWRLPGHTETARHA